MWCHWPLWLMEDRLPGFSLSSVQQGSQQWSQQAIISVAISVFTLLEHTRTHLRLHKHTPSCQTFFFFLKIEHEEHHKLKRLMTPNSLFYCGKKPWDVDIKAPRLRDVHGAHQNIHSLHFMQSKTQICPSLHVTKRKSSTRDLLVLYLIRYPAPDYLLTPEYITVYFTLLHEEEHHLKSKWAVWFILSHLIKGSSRIYIQSSQKMLACTRAGSPYLNQAQSMHKNHHMCFSDRISVLKLQMIIK